MNRSRSAHLTSERSEPTETPLVTHICIVCSQEFQQKQPIVQFPAGPEKSSKVLDEFSIFFGLQCLNLSTDEAEELFANLVDVVGEPGNWCVSFCPYHMEMVKKGLEMDMLIQRLQNQLNSIKGLLGNAISEDFIKENVNGNRKKNIAFQMIRERLRAVKNNLQSSSPENISTIELIELDTPESSPMTPINKAEPASPRKKKQQRVEVETSIQTTPDSTMSNSESHEHEHEVKPDLDSSFTSPPVINFDDGNGRELRFTRRSISERPKERRREVQQYVFEHPDDIPSPSFNFEGEPQKNSGITRKKRLSKESLFLTKKRTKTGQSSSVRGTKAKAKPKNMLDNPLNPWTIPTKTWCICKFCPMTFITPAAREMHIKNSHGIRENHLRGSRGSKTYNPVTVRIPISPSENIQSRIQQLLKGPTSYECFKCHQEFPSSAQINRHKRFCDFIPF